MWTSLPSKNQIETVGMIIKNQNTPYFFLCASCWLQASHLLNHENLPRAETVLSVCGSEASRIRLMIAARPNEARRERQRSIARAFSFHNLTLWQPSDRRYRASVGL